MLNLMNDSMTPTAMLAQGFGNQQLWVLPVLGGFGLLMLFFIVFVVKQYKRCPSNRVLVIYGKVGSNRAARCLHGGGAFVLPLIQDYAYLTLEPMVIDIPLEGALSMNNIRVNVPATFTVGVSTDPVLMNNAAERLLMLEERKIREQAQDIILGQLRLVIATLSIEEINKDREKFMTLINENVAQEINKIGLELINVNIRDITDESGYIVAIGQRAAAEAINRAKVEVAEQDRDGAVGEAMARREMNVTVADRQAETVAGEKRAERQERIQVAEAERGAVEAGIAAWEGLMTAEASIESLRAQVRAAEIALEGVEQEALVGSRTTLDVLDAEQELLNARVSLVQAQRNEVVAGFQILSAIGSLTAADLGLPVQLYDLDTDYERTRGRWWGTSID